MKTEYNELGWKQTVRDVVKPVGTCMLQFNVFN